MMRNVACLLALGTATGFLVSPFTSNVRSMPQMRRSLGGELRSEPPKASQMTARELKAELASLGASTAGLFDKESLIAALDQARARGAKASASDNSPSPAPQSTDSSATTEESTTTKKKKASSSSSTVRPSPAPAGPVDVDVIAETPAPSSSTKEVKKKKKAAGASPASEVGASTSTSTSGADQLPSLETALAEIKAQKMTVRV